MSRRKQRYQVQYFRWVTATGGGARRPDAYGSSDNLQNLVRNAAGRCAIENYRKAVIFDHRKGARVRVLNRTKTGITITENPDG